MTSRRPVLALLALAALGCGPDPATLGMPAPAGARALDTVMAGWDEEVAISPDRKQIAYAVRDASGPPKIMVAAIGGAAWQLSLVFARIEQLTWGAGGGALWFSSEETRVIPGRWLDWDIPATEPVAHRITRTDVRTGVSRTMSETKERLLFKLATQADALVYIRERQPEGGSGPLVSYDLATGAETGLDGGEDASAFAIAPDGATVAYRPVSSAARTIDLVGRAGGVRVQVSAEGVYDLAWLDADRLLLAEGRRGTERERLRLRTVSRAGAQLALVDVEGEGYDYDLARGLSPDGKWLVTRGRFDATQLIDVATGKVRRGAQYPWLGWLDATTLLGRFQGRLYAMPLASAFDLTAP